jgi:lipoate-protein ligase A
MNMAIDEALLESVGAGSSPPTLRLYGWEPGCLSLGHAQPVGDIDRLALEAQGWDLVRRPTGGKAILHVDELTYALIAPAGHPALRGGVLASYRRLSRGLTAGLARLGLEVDPPNAEPTPGDEQNPICFEAPSAYEITGHGKKLLGSAQLRRKDAILQHGTLPLAGDISRICLTLRYQDPQARRIARERLLARATTVEMLLNRSVGWDEAAAALKSGFEDAFGWTFSPTDLTEVEHARAHELELSRYSEPAWISRV